MSKFPAKNIVCDIPVQLPDYVYIIAEAGINHNGDIEIAKQLIDMAHAAGCDAVKFQKRDPEVCVPKDWRNKMRSTPWGEMTYLDYRYRVEFGEKEYDILDAYARKLGIDWFASAWDIPSQKFLRKYNCPFNKVASAMATNLPLLEEIASDKKMTFLSTGMCTYEDIDKALAIFKAKGCPVTLLHTVSTYPAQEKDLNLLGMNDLRRRYGLPVGYSGHEPSVSPSVIACALGAVVIERHITVDRALFGTDQAASLEKPGLETMVAQIRKIPALLGTGVKSISAEEKVIAGKLRYWETAAQ